MSYSPEQDAIWQFHKPSKTMCAVCGCYVLKLERIRERRPTGAGGSVQDWIRCPICEAEYQKQEAYGLDVVACQAFARLFVPTDHCESLKSRIRHSVMIPS